MLNLTKISKEENKTCIHYKQEKVSGEISLLSALLVGYFSYVFY